MYFIFVKTPYEALKLQQTFWGLGAKIIVDLSKIWMKPTREHFFFNLKEQPLPTIKYLQIKLLWCYK